MMGQRTGGQKPLFYSFKRDDHVPADHLLRGIDRCLDLGELRACEKFKDCCSFMSPQGAAESL
jgi:hypothetical protein